MPTSTTREEPSKMDFFTKQGGYNLTSIVRKKMNRKTKGTPFSRYSYARGYSAQVNTQCNT